MHLRKMYRMKNAIIARNEKGWQHKWVYKKIGIPYKEHVNCKEWRCGDLYEEQSNNKWTKITRGNKITKTIAPYYLHLSNAYAQLEELSEDLIPPTPEHKTSTTIKTNDRTKNQSKFKLKAERRRQTKFTKYMNKMKDEGIIDLYIWIVRR